MAQQSYPETSVQFCHTEELVPAGDFDLVFSNGVMHHIDPSERGQAFSLMRDSLRPGGLCAIWENSPWSLPAQYCMRVNEFDRDAQMISAGAVRRLGVAAGLRVISTSYCFIFPKRLSRLRWVEPLVCRVPLGAQYFVLFERARATGAH